VAEGNSRLHRQREMQPRQTMRKRLQAKLGEVKAELRRRMHDRVPAVGKWLRAVVEGHIRYYGVPTNYQALALFRKPVERLWRRALSRPQSAPDALGAGAAHLPALVAQAPHLSSVSTAPPRRHHLRQEPDAVIPLVRIRAGGREQSRSLLRLPALLFLARV
jgi:hypothetical protein